MSARRSVVIFGAGAVGCYLGGKLAIAAERDDHLPTVALVGRQALVDTVRTHGLTVRDLEGDAVTHPHAVSAAAQLSPCDLVVLTVRSYDIESSLPDVAALLGERGLVVAMQNGVGSEELIAKALGRHRVLVGTTTVSVGLAEPGVVRRNSRSGGVALATMSGAPVPAWILQAFEASGLPTVAVSDYRSLRWSKLLLNMLGAVACATLDVDMPVVVSHPGLFRIEQLALREAGRIMDAQDIATLGLPGFPTPLVRLAMRLPRPLAQRALAPRIRGARGGRPPTMRTDMARGRTEVAYLNGGVVDAAGRLGLRAPVNAALTALADDLTAHPDHRAEFQGRPERLVAYMKGRGIHL